MASFSDLVKQLTVAAGREGVNELLIIFRDPRTRQVRLLATAGAVDRLKSDIAEKLNLSDADSAITGWEQ